MEKREIEIVVLSDIHLGTHGCRATELLSYLDSIIPKILVLNGDIVDLWQFKKNYWPEAHQKIMQKLMEFIESDIPVYYLPGNHDEMLRIFTEFKLSKFKLCDEVVLDVSGKKAWILHGDVFDITMQKSKWIAKFGAFGYDLIIRFNHFLNYFTERLFKKRIMLSKLLKDSVKTTVKYMSDFENKATNIAIDNEYDYVICGHIHNPKIKRYQNEKGSVLYLNSGDWIENLTSLEFYDNKWHIYQSEIKVLEFGNKLFPFKNNLERGISTVP